MEVRERTRRLIGEGGAAETVVVRKAVTIRRPREEVQARWREESRLPGYDATVEFRTAPGDRGTEVLAEVVYTPSNGAAGDALAKLRGRDPGSRVAEELRRFKQLLEVGEVVRA